MMNCETCKRGTDPVPYIVHESAMARQERTIRRLWVLLLVVVCLLIGTNGLWIYYESQFVSESTEVEQEIDTGDGDAFVVGVGDLNYGEGQTENNEADTDP